MADTRARLFQRVVSAIFAAAVLVAMGYFGGRPGLLVACTMAIVLGLREYSRMAFVAWRMPRSIKHWFWLVSLFFYAGMVRFHEQGLTFFALANVLFFTGTLWLTRGRVSNDTLLPALATGTFGMLYCVLCPYFALQLVRLDQGPQWFAFLLLLVFGGDTFAYFGGRFFGRHKFMPNISPNKTWEGSVAGLFGSVLVAGTYSQFALDNCPLWKVLPFCVLCGFVAQSGDLLMSLVKRVAQVKDSGHIMPGHGGILDRLDGIFVACPLIYAFALYVTDAI